ncbi:MAG: MFS transporter [Bacteroidetes bacterium]|nr:MAG: MFS transporter [Bacteroidota bacterium]
MFNNTDLKVNNTKNNEFQTGNVILVSFSHLLHDIYSSFLSPVLPILIKNLGISYSLTSLLSVIRTLPSLANPFIGLLADKVSLRYFIIIAPTITATIMSLLGFASSYIVLAIMLFVMGISASLYHVPAPVMVKKVSGNRAGMGMSFYMLGGELARTLGPLVILAAISLWGFKGAYRLIPFAIIASIILFFKLRKISVYKEFQNKNKQFGKKETVKKYSSVFLIIAAYLFFISIIKSALTYYLPTYLNLQGGSLWLGGIALSAYQLAGAGGTFLSGTISDKIGSKKTLLIASITAPVLMLLFTFSEGVVLPFILLILLGLFIFASGPVLLAIITNFDAERPAFINGVYMTISFIVGSITIMLVGVLADKFGLEATYRIISIIGFGAFPFVILLSKQKSVKH